jgi:type II secretory pathway pseudopilin PulG
MPSAARRRIGLTLIEIIVVIAIVTVLMTLTVAMGQYMIKQSMYNQTEQLLVSLDQATLRYKNDRGIWPYEFDGNGDGAPDYRTDTAVHELTRRTDAVGGVRTPYFEGSSQSLRLNNPYSPYNNLYNNATQGYYAVWDAFQSRPTNLAFIGDQGGAHVHGWERNDPRVAANHFMPFWHSGGDDYGFREYNAGTGSNLSLSNFSGSNDIYSTCFAQ